MTALKIAKPKDSESIRFDPKDELILATRNLQKIQDACRVAVTYRRLIGICGEPGFGKTVALDHFKRENANVFMMTVKPSMGAKTFWLELMENIYGPAGRVSSSTYKRPLYFTLKRICERLNQLESPLLIIDEAGKLSKQMLLNLHELRDETKRNVGIILAGPTYFRENLKHWAARSEEGIQELMTRINTWIDLERPTIQEMRSICKEYGITDPEGVKGLVYKVDDFRTLHNRITDYMIENSINPL